MNSLTETELNAKSLDFLPLVKAIARDTLTSLEYEYRSQEGYLGLRHALKHFDERKIRRSSGGRTRDFVRYARKCIRGYIFRGTEQTCNQFGLPQDNYWIPGLTTQIPLDGLDDFERDQLLGLSQAFNSDLDQQELRTEVERAMSTLTERERTVLRLRFGLNGNPSQILSDVGRRLRLTAEGVRQIESKALNKLKLRICREKVGRDAAPGLSGKLKRVP